MYITGRKTSFWHASMLITLFVVVNTASAAIAPAPMVRQTISGQATISWQTPAEADSATFYLRADDAADWAVIPADKTVIDGRNAFQVKLDSLQAGKTHHYFWITQGATAQRSPDYTFEAMAAPTASEVDFKTAIKNQLEQFLSDVLNIKTGVSFADASIVLNDLTIRSQTPPDPVAQIGKAVIRHIASNAAANAPAEISGRFENVRFQKDADQRLQIDALDIEDFSIDLEAETASVAEGSLSAFSFQQGDERIGVDSLNARHASIHENRFEADHLAGANLNLSMTGETIVLAGGACRGLVFEPDKILMLDALEATGLSMTDMDGTRYEAGRINVAGLYLPNLDKPTLNPNLTVEIQPLTVWPDGEHPIAIEKISFKTSTTPAASRLTVNIDRLELDMEDRMSALMPPALLSQLPGTSARSLCLDIALAFILDHTAQTARLEKLDIHLANLADLRLSLQLTGVRVDVNNMQASMLTNLFTAALKSARLTYTDASLLTTIWRHQAQTEETTVDALQQRLAAQIKSEGAAANSAVLQSLSESMAAFILDPGTLDIRIQPTAPIPLVILMDTQLNDDYLTPLNIQITARP